MNEDEVIEEIIIYEDGWVDTVVPPPDPGGGGDV